MNQPVFGSDPVTPNTTYVQADPSTFRSVVQKLTGAPEDPSSPKLPLTLPPRFSNPKPDMGPRRPAFKLHERRQAVKKLELNLIATSTALSSAAAAAGAWLSPFQRAAYRCCGGGDQTVMASPVSTLEFLARGSPRTPPRQEGWVDEEEEERAIAEKGFYLHPSPINTPRPGWGFGSDPPELLVLFPLHSPRDNDHHNSSTTSCS